MREVPTRRFNLGDAMVMIAAITPSLVLIRIGVGFGLFEVGKLTETGGQSSSLGRQLVEIFNVGGGCVLAGLVPAVLILGLYRAQPSWRDAVRGPGDRQPKNALFRSMARDQGSGALAAILPGMGKDVAVGMREVRALGGYTIVQDKSTSILYGTADFAVRPDAVCESLLIQQIAPLRDAAW
jgi:hypothetical protein